MEPLKVSLNSARETKNTVCYEELEADEQRHATRHSTRENYVTSKTAHQLLKLAPEARLIDEATRCKAGHLPANEPEVTP